MKSVSHNGWLDVRWRSADGGITVVELPHARQRARQFIFDHGTNDDFQRQYGHLDLHAVRWQQFAPPAFEILACSIYPHFAEFVEALADRTRIMP